MMYYCWVSLQTVVYCATLWFKTRLYIKRKTCFFIVMKLSLFSAHLLFVFDIDEKVSY